MDPILIQNITIDPLDLKEFGNAKVVVDVLRLDKVHSEISGNKWFKLQFYLQDAIRQNKKIVTFGGAWSNHILAVAAACSFHKIDCVGIIRGEKTNALSETLIKAEQLGMRIEFIDRQNYKAGILPEEFTNEKYYIIPAGGYGVKGAEGAAGITDHVDTKVYSGIYCAIGTGTMMAGLMIKERTTPVIGMSVLKNNHSAESDIRHLLPEELNSLQIINDYHFGGYAKYTNELIEFMNNCYQQSGIPTDFVYTGKLFFGVTELIRKNLIETGSRILLIHSGGLQGNLSLRKGTLIF